MNRETDVVHSGEFHKNQLGEKKVTLIILPGTRECTWWMFPTFSIFLCISNQIKRKFI